MGKGAKKKTKWISLSLVDSSTAKPTNDKDELSKTISTKSYKSILSNSISTTVKERPPHRELTSQLSENNVVRRKKFSPSHGFNQENTNEAYNSRRSFHPKRPYYNSHYNNRFRNEKDFVRNDENEGKKNYVDDEYTRITTPRQDVLFKKGYLSRPKKYLQPQEQTAVMPIQIASPSCDSSLAGTSTEESIISDSMSPEQVYTPNGMDYGVPYCGYVDENGLFVMNPVGYDGYNSYYPQNQMMMYPVQWPYNECGNFEYYTNDCKEHCQNNFEKDKKSVDGFKEDEAAISELTQPDEKTSNDEETVTNVLNIEQNVESTVNAVEKNDAINPAAEIPPYYNPYYYPGYVYRQYPYVSYYENNSIMNNEGYVRQSKYRKKKRRFRPTSSNGTTTTTDHSGEDSSDDHRNHLETEFPLNSTLNANVQEFLPSSKLSSLSPSTSFELKNNTETSTNINNTIKESMQIDSATEKTENTISSKETTLQNASTYKDNFMDSASNNNNNNNNVIKSAHKSVLNQTSVLSKKQLIESTKSITEQNIDLAKHEVAFKNSSNNNLSNQWTVVCKGKRFVHDDIEDIEIDLSPTSNKKSEDQVISPKCSSPIEVVDQIVEDTVDEPKTLSKNKKSKIKNKKSKKTKMSQVQAGFQVIEPDFSAKETSEEPINENEIIHNIEDYLGPEDIEHIMSNDESNELQLKTNVPVEEIIQKFESSDISEIEKEKEFLLENTRTEEINDSQNVTEIIPDEHNKSEIVQEEIAGINQAVVQPDIKLNEILNMQENDTEPIILQEQIKKTVNLQVKIYESESPQEKVIDLKHLQTNITEPVDIQEKIQKSITLHEEKYELVNLQDKIIEPVKLLEDAIKFMNSQEEIKEEFKESVNLREKIKESVNLKEKLIVASESHERSANHVILQEEVDEDLDLLQRSFEPEILLGDNALQEVLISNIILKECAEFSNFQESCTEPIIVMQEAEPLILLEEAIDPVILPEENEILLAFDTNQSFEPVILPEKKVFEKAVLPEESEIFLEGLNTNELFNELVQPKAKIFPENESLLNVLIFNDVIDNTSANQLSEKPTVLLEDIIETKTVPLITSEQEIISEEPSHEKIALSEVNPNNELTASSQNIEITEEPILGYPLEAIQEEDEEKEIEIAASMSNYSETSEVHVTEAVSKWLQTNLETKNLNELFKIPEDPLLLDIISKFNVPGFYEHLDDYSSSDSCDDENRFDEVDDKIYENDQISLPDTDSDYMSDIQVRNNDNQMNSKLSNELIKDDAENENIKDSTIQTFSKTYDESLLTDPINPDAIVTVKAANQNSLKNKSCILM